MPLASGDRLGPYQIVAPLGSGGMGDVYKARDTRLDRTVAIKVLPASLSSDPEFRERFDREARSISALDHPHICAVYDVGEAPSPEPAAPGHEPIRFIVMQFLEGETLAERLSRRRPHGLALPDALKIAVEIADALDNAHRAGIVHRDLKPANVMLTKAGAKLLDFGLAKGGPAGVRFYAAGAGPEPASPFSALPTTPPALTAQGTILGTFQYMAPEQIEGEEADPRTDIFALGLLLHEMVTGRPAFTGKTQGSLMSAILKDEPQPVSQLQPIAPAGLDRIIRTCLAKDRDDRWQTARDLARELRWLQPASSSDARAAQPHARRGSRSSILAMAALAMASVVVAAWAFWWHRPAGDAPALKLSVLPPENGTFTPFYAMGTPHFALSPDGRRIVFGLSRGGRSSLWVRSLDSRAVQQLPGTEDGSSPFWSPDGESIGFFAQGKLKKMSLRDTRPETLASVPDSRGGTWSADGVILFGRNSGPIGRVSATGGPAADVTQLKASFGHGWPQFLPDRRHFIYADDVDGSFERVTFAGSLDSADTTRVLAAGATAVYAPAGYLLFVRSKSLMAQPFDPALRKPAGPALTVLDQIGYAAGAGYPPVSASGNGLLAYWDGITVRTQLQWIDRQGKALPSIPGLTANTFAISPDDRQVALERVDPEARERDIWLLDARGTMSRFTFNRSGAPVWSPDGRELVFASDTKPGLFRRAGRGGEKEQAVAKESGTFGFPTDWSPDGRIIVHDIGSNTGWDLGTVAIDSGKAAGLLRTAANEIQGRVSPDGRWLAYASDESGRFDVFVQLLSLTGAKWQISADGGSQPAWRRDGKELFYLAADRKLMAVSIDSAAGLVAGVPHALFETRMRPTYEPYSFSYAATSDGQRFLINAAEPGSDPTVSMVVNWTALLRKE